MAARQAVTLKLARRRGGDFEYPPTDGVRLEAVHGQIALSQSAEQREEQQRLHDEECVCVCVCVARTPVLTLRHACEQAYLSADQLASYRTTVYTSTGNVDTIL